MMRNSIQQMTLLGIGLIVILVFMSGTVIQASYAQTDNSITTGEQTIISEDIADNPLAQEILKKIEQTKKWIEELEQRNYEKIEKQKELEEKRKQSLVKLNQDLIEWEKLWEYYSPKQSYERFVDKIPDAHVKEVFWDQFEFKEQKVKAGRDALKKVIAEGGSLRDARQAYLLAAETKRIELIEANSQFNVRHNLAYYNQQILFDKEGKFIDSQITGEQLRKYYEDYKTNPEYLKANPDDTLSWDDINKTNQNTKCREGQIVIHRFHANDYVCVTIHTAELWIKHGMGEILGDSSGSSNDEQIVTPLTRCDEGFVVIHNKETKKNSCILEDTARQWVDNGIAEYPDPEEYIMKSIQRNEAAIKIEEINHQISEIEMEYSEKKEELRVEYEKKHDQMLEDAKRTEKAAIKEFNENEDISKEELSHKITAIRENYDSEIKDLIKDERRDIKKLEKELRDQMLEFAEDYEDNPFIKVISNSSRTGFEAIARE